MWQNEFVIETNLKKEKIWALWDDVRNWNKWNTSIEYSNINGNFKDGTYGSFKTAEGINAVYKSFVLRNCIQNKSFIGRVKLFFCIMDLGHEMIEEDNKLIVKHYIRLNGLLAFRYKKTIGVNMSSKLQESVKNLIKLAGG